MAVDVDSETRARAFAIKAHGEQRYGAHPYVVHLDDVADNARTLDGSSAVRVAAYLHDVLEDTDTPASVLRAEFGDAVVDLVLAVTKEPGLTRKAGMKATLSKVRAAGQDAVLLKLCDRLANVRRSRLDTPGLFAMYRGEHPAFQSALRVYGWHDFAWALLDEAVQ